MKLSGRNFQLTSLHATNQRRHRPSAAAQINFCRDASVIFLINGRTDIHREREKKWPLLTDHTRTAGTDSQT